MLGAIRDLSRLELAGGSLRAALEALAAAAPGWLVGVIDPSWQQVYGARIDDLHLPEGQARRRELMVRYGTDGYCPMERACEPAAPGWLRELPVGQSPAARSARSCWTSRRDARPTTRLQSLYRKRGCACRCPGSRSIAGLRGLRTFQWRSWSPTVAPGHPS